jgi:hypothetical protein
MDHPLARGRIEKFGKHLERRRDQHVRKPVLRAAEQRERITDIEAHRLASAGDRHMKACGWIGRNPAQLLGNEVGNRAVIGVSKNIFERSSVRSRNDVNTILGECDFRQPIVFAQPVKPAWSFG